MRSFLFGLVAVCATGALAEGAFPFIAVRNMGSGAANPRFTEAIFAASGYDGQHSAPPGHKLPDTVWSMTPDGKRHPGVFCPTSPEVRELNLKSTTAVIGGLKPYSYCPDDDLRMTKRGSRIFFCDRFSCEYSGGTPKPILGALRGEKASQVVVGHPRLCGTCSFPSGFGGTIILTQYMFPWTICRGKCLC